MLFDSTPLTLLADEIQLISPSQSSDVSGDSLPNADLVIDGDTRSNAETCIMTGMY